MDVPYRSRLAFGLILVLVGAWFLAVRLVPSLQAWANLSLHWPTLIIGAGLLLLLFGVVVGAPAMAVPASILMGLGALLYWQNATGRWESWAYAWALIPGFVGLGLILRGILSGGHRESLRGGAGLVLMSLILFFVFGSFLGGWTLLGPYWPALLILLGVVLLAQSLMGRRRSADLAPPKSGSPDSDAPAT